VPSRDWGPVLAALRDGSIGDARPALVNRALLLGHDVAPGTVGCSLTELDRAAFRTPAASSQLALELDEAQYAEAAGPCVDAARARRPQQVDVMTEEPRFPVFCAAATQHGVRSSLSVPVAGRSLPTALNLYSTQRAAFASDRARGIADLLARVIGALSAPEDRRVGAEADLAGATADGERVSAALELVMRRRTVDRAAAFAVLVADSRAREMGMRAVADVILAGKDEP